MVLVAVEEGGGGEEQGGGDKGRGERERIGGDGGESPSREGSPAAPPAVVVGVAALLRSRPRALLPPPAPSRAPLVPYLGNLAVCPRARRAGVATRLLAAAERAAAAFGDSELWLHGRGGRGGSGGGGSLYAAAGYRRVEEEGGDEGQGDDGEGSEGGGGGRGVEAAAAAAAAAARTGEERVLLRKRLPPRGRRQQQQQKQKLAEGEAGQGGVYLWRVVENVEDERGGETRGEM